MTNYETLSSRELDSGPFEVRTDVMGGDTSLLTVSTAVLASENIDSVG